MQQFSMVYKTIWTSRDAGVNAITLLQYLQTTNTEDKVLALSLLSGKKMQSTVSIQKLAKWCMSYKAIPEWMLKKCHATVNDWAETLSLILGNPAATDTTEGLMECVLVLRSLGNSEARVQTWIQNQWAYRTPEELFIIHKIITGALKPVFKISVLADLIAQAYHTDSILIHYRLNKVWQPDISFDQFISSIWSDEEQRSKPLPFTPAEIIHPDQFHFGDPEAWVVEPFMHGTHLQVHRLEDSLAIWNSEHELVTEDWEDTVSVLLNLPPRSAIEILLPSPPAEKDYTIILLDILRWRGKPGKELGALDQRKQLLYDWKEQLAAIACTILPHTTLEQWNRIKDAGNTATGWIIKHVLNEQSYYRVKPKGHEAQVQIMYVEYINQNSAIEYTLTAGVSNELNELVPVCKIHSNTIAESDKMALYYWIQNNTVQRFGPVRSVRSGQVLKIEYDRAEVNKRVKSGINLVNVKVLAWIRHDATINTLEEIKRVIL